MKGSEKGSGRSRKGSEKGSGRSRKGSEKGSGRSKKGSEKGSGRSKKGSHARAPGVGEADHEHVDRGDAEVPATHKQPLPVMPGQRARGVSGVLELTRCSGF